MRNNRIYPVQCRTESIFYRTAFPSGRCESISIFNDERSQNSKRKQVYLTMEPCQAFEEMLEQERRKAALKIAAVMLSAGTMTHEEIAYCVGLPPDEIDRLSKKSKL